jgi:hypothetical protein
MGRWGSWERLQLPITNYQLPITHYLLFNAMNSLDAITIKAFLNALTRLEVSLPVDLQKQVNEIGQNFPESVPKLHRLARSFLALEQVYMEARLTLQEDGDRLKFAVPESEEFVQISDEQILHFTVEILLADDSVTVAKKALTKVGNKQGQTVRRLSEFYGVLPATKPYPGKEAIREEVGEQLTRQTFGEKV